MVSTKNRPFPRLFGLLIGFLFTGLVILAAVMTAATLIGQGGVSLPPPELPMVEVTQPPNTPTPLVPSATPTPTPSATPMPTETAPPTATATLPPPTATPMPSFLPPAPFTTLTGFDSIAQTFNNCGPATLAMQLSYFGSDQTQAAIGGMLRPNPEDKNVTPIELADYARSQGYRALVRVNGNGDLMRTLLANQIPVIIETWLEPHPNDGLGHYRLLTGYNDADAHWIGYDSYYRENLINPNGPYAGIRMPYAETDALWRVFNRTYVVVYGEAQSPVVESILGADRDDFAMWQGALATAQAETAQNGADPYGWFNQGSALTALGRFNEAAAAFDQARAIGLPWRMLWYQYGPFHAYYESERYQEVIALADSVLRPAVQIEELHDWRARAYAALGNADAAESARQRIAFLNSRYQPTYAEIPRPAATVTSAPIAPIPTAPPPAATTPPTALAAFLADVTIPDGTVLSAGESFVKTWRVRNAGAGRWEGYLLRPVVSEGTQTGQFGNPTAIALPVTAAGESAEISIPLSAPATPGTYTGYWQIVTPDGEPVKGGQLWLVVAVQ